MLIVGGTYDERCANPSIDMLAGSGLRAAAALSPSIPVNFVSAISDGQRQVAELTAAALAPTLEVTWLRRSERVGFSYFTPLASPGINGAKARIDDPWPQLDDEVALVFGMLEAGTQPIHARRAVFDPQKPRDLEQDAVDWPDADEIVLVLNESETRQLGGATDLAEAAGNLLGRAKTVAVVTKRGPRGALVVTAHGAIPIGPRRTETVYAVGSGDVFAAGFAHAWLIGGADPVEAAKVGSAAAAYWCSTMEFALPAEVLAGQSQFDEVPVVEGALVYLAGPFFTLAQRWLVDVVHSALRPHVWSPFHVVGLGGPEVAAKDLEGLDNSDAMLALVDGTDSGTLFEIGYATRSKIPVIAYGERSDDEAYKMLVGTNAEVLDDLTTAIYRSVWAAMSRRASVL